MKLIIHPRTPTAECSGIPREKNSSETDPVTKLIKKVRFDEGTNDTHIIRRNLRSYRIRMAPSIQSRLNKGDRHLDLHHLEKALRIYKSALKMLSLYRKPHPKQIAEIYFSIGTVQYCQDKLEESRSSFEDAFAIEHEDEDLIDRICYNLGLVYQGLEQYKKAEEYFLMALALDKDLYPLTYPDSSLMERLTFVSDKVASEHYFQQIYDSPDVVDSD
jgi:tetratricopeptide (TPR) repeat protein